MHTTVTLAILSYFLNALSFRERWKMRRANKLAKLFLITLESILSYTTRFFFLQRIKILFASHLLYNLRCVVLSRMLLSLKYIALTYISLTNVNVRFERQCQAGVQRQQRQIAC